MTEINHNSLAGHHAVDDASRHPGDREKGGNIHGGQILDDHSHDSTVGSVTISFNAHMRLRAYEDQQKQFTIDPGLLPVNSLSAPGSDAIENGFDEALSVLSYSKAAGISDFNFSEQMHSMLAEVEQNIVQTSEPGYQYLVNMLNNYKTSVDNPQQLQEIMRREEFYLSRRKPFMEITDFHSYSQVLSQFSNIIERQQYSS